MRTLRFLLCALVLAWPMAAQAATKKKAKAVKSEEITLAELLGKDLAAAVEAANAAYDDAEEALTRHAKRKRSSNNTVLREMSEARGDYAKALQRARDARVDVDSALLRDQVVVSITQSLRAIDLITQGLRDDDDDQVDAGVELAGMAQADLNSIAEGGSASGEAAGGAPTLGPSMGMNFGMSSQASSFNTSLDLNFSMPLSEALDAGLGGSMNVSSSEASASGSLNMGGNTFVRYHFLQAFSARPNWVPYLGAKIGLTLGTQWSGTGLNFNTSDSNGTEMSGQAGMLFFMDAKSALTVEFEAGSQSSTSTPTTGAATTSSGSSMGLSLGLRRMF